MLEHCDLALNHNSPKNEVPDPVTKIATDANIGKVTAKLQSSPPQQPDFTGTVHPNKCLLATHSSSSWKDDT